MYRFIFTEGGSDLNFFFHLDDGEWKLIAVRPQIAVPVFPDDEDEPKERFE